MIVTIYDVGTGRILKTIQAPQANMSQVYLLDGEAMLQGNYPPKSYYMRDGVPTPFPDAPDGMMWDWDALAWTDPISIEEMSAKAVVVIKALRNEKLGAGFNYAGALISTDDASLNAISRAAFDAAQDSASVLNWKLADDSVVCFSAADVLVLNKLVQSYIQSCRDRANDLIFAAQSGQAYDLGSGWPDNSFVTAAVDG